MGNLKGHENRKRKQCLLLRIHYIPKDIINQKIGVGRRGGRAHFIEGAKKNGLLAELEALQEERRGEGRGKKGDDREEAGLGKIVKG